MPRRSSQGCPEELIWAPEALFQRSKIRVSTNPDFRPTQGLKRTLLLHHQTHEKQLAVISSTVFGLSLATPSLPPSLPPNLPSHKLLAPGASPAAGQSVV